MANILQSSVKNAPMPEHVYDVARHPVSASRRGKHHRRRSPVLSVLLALLLFGGGAFVIILLSGCIVLSHITLKQRRQISSILSFDHETGFLNRGGFLEELKRLAARGKNEYTIIYFAMDEYIRLARIMDEKQRNEYAEHAMRCLRDYIYSPHITARMGEASYAVAIFEKMEMKEAGDIARGISLELL